MKDLLIIAGIVVVIILLMRNQSVKKVLSPYEAAKPVTVISNGAVVTPQTQVNSNALDGLQIAS